ncbi:MAG: hypothetical protein AAF191_00515 [Verrucomicrobiota bacterium]
MVRYFVYFPMHVLGILLVFVALGGMTVWIRAQGLGTEPPFRRRTLSILHGVGLFLILTGGFGLMKVVGIKHASAYPNWVLVKFAVWLVLCVSSLLLLWKPKLSWWFLMAFIALGVFSASVGKFKQAVVPDRKVTMRMETPPIETLTAVKLPRKAVIPDRMDERASSRGRAVSDC